ncbi:MAG TPA: hypothetical protein PK867_29180 [Pirellulales bacterium]|nr:hypothetical protein [Pirellulales bacterium]
MSQYVEYRDGGYWIARSRVSLGSVVYAYQQGKAPEDISHSFSAISLAQIDGAIAVYLSKQCSGRRMGRKRGRRVDQPNRAFALASSPRQLFAATAHHGLSCKSSTPKLLRIGARDGASAVLRARRRARRAAVKSVRKQPAARGGGLASAAGSAVRGAGPLSLWCGRPACFFRSGRDAHTTNQATILTLTLAAHDKMLW